MIKRIAVFIISIILILNVMAIPAFANEAVLEESYDNYELMEGLLAELGIIDRSNMPGSKHTMTRGEFAGYMSKVLKLSSTLEDVFWDVPNDYEYREEINLLASLGCVSGNTDGSFAPNEPITYGAAVKILVCALGYGNYAELAGGYFIGYQKMAKKSGIVSGDTINYNQNLDSRSFIELMYNALNAPKANVSVISSEENGEYSEKIGNDGGETLLSENFNIKYAEGIVEANSYSSIKNSGMVIDDSIIINGVSYKCDDKYEKYLGYNIACFFEESNDGNLRTVRFAYPTEDVKIYKLSTSAGAKLSNSKISYYTSNREVTKRIDTLSLCVLYNFKPIDYVNEFNNDLFDIDKGFIILIDSNSDGAIDLIHIKRQVDMVVKNIDLEEMKIYGDKKGTVAEDKKENEDFLGKYEYKLEFSFDRPLEIDKNGFLSITDTFGRTLELKDISPNNTISYVQSKDGEVCEINLSYDYLEGKIDSIGESGEYYILTIDSYDYKALKSDFETGLTLSATYTFYRNYLGDICYAKESKASAMKLVYLIGVYKKSPLGGCTASIINEKNELVDLDFADRVCIDGKSIKCNDVLAYFNTHFTVSEGGKYIKELIRYSVNADGKINHVDTSFYNKSCETEDTLRLRYEGDKLNYQSGDKNLKRFYIAGGPMRDAGFATNAAFMYGVVDGEIFVTVEPSSEPGGDISLDDVTVYDNIPLERTKSNDDVVSAKLYSIGDTTPIMCGAVIRNKEGTTKFTSELYVVTGKGKSIDPKGNECDFLSLGNGKSESIMYFSDKYSTDPSKGSDEAGIVVSMEEIEVGDIIRYSVDSAGYLNCCLRVFAYADKEVMVHNGFLAADPRITGGVVYDVNDIYLRLLSVYKNENSTNPDKIDKINPSNVETAIQYQLQLLKDKKETNTNPLLSMEPEYATAVESMAELVYLKDVVSYKVERDKVYFSDIKIEDIPDYVHYGSDCATIIITTASGNLPTKSAIVIE